jgi:hypothetical protein
VPARSPWAAFRAALFFLSALNADNAAGCAAVAAANLVRWLYPWIERAEPGGAAFEMESATRFILRGGSRQSDGQYGVAEISKLKSHCFQ